MMIGKILASLLLLIVVGCTQYYLAGLYPKSNSNFLALGHKTNQLNDAWIGELSSTGGITSANILTAAGYDSLELATATERRAPFIWEYKFVSGHVTSASFSPARYIDYEPR